MITFKAKTESGEIIKSALSDFKFPAGEAHTKREEQRDLESTEIAILQPSADSLHDDLFALAMWSNYVKIENSDLPPEAHSERVLVIPYLPGARADRGKPFGLGVYADFIRKLALNQIIIFDPHSGMTGDELHAASDTLTFVTPAELLSQPYLRDHLEAYTGIIAPDKGAVGRAGAVADALGLPLYTAEKTRDFETGKLSGFKLDGLPESTDDKDEFFLIVDDICDGGGTFLGLEAAIGLGFGKVDLYVSHGVFSKDALTNLPEKFEYIYTTNSYDPHRNLGPLGEEEYSQFERFDIIRLLLSKIK